VFFSALYPKLNPLPLPILIPLLSLLKVPAETPLKKHSIPTALSTTTYI